MSADDIESIEIDAAEFERQAKDYQISNFGHFYESQHFCENYDYESDEHGNRVIVFKSFGQQVDGQEVDDDDGGGGDGAAGAAGERAAEEEAAAAAAAEAQQQQLGGGGGSLPSGVEANA